MAMQSKTFVACCIAVASTCIGAVDTAAATTSATVYRPKRGYVADGCTGSNCTDPTLLTSIGWYYAYNVGDPYCSGSASTTSSTLRGSNAVDESAYTCSLPLQTEAKLFTPMHWCIDNLNDTVPSYVNTTFMMGYNEPNNAHNCNKDATTVAQSWSRVMSGWPNSNLVSPATSGNGIAWYDEFFAACKSLYGPSGCNITHMATHDYSCNADTTMGYLKELYDRYKLPIWLTEFSCEDGAAGRPTADHLKFMKDIVPMLDAAPYVYRYAWMSAHDGRGLRGLFGKDANGKTVLTVLGQAYNTL